MIITISSHMAMDFLHARVIVLRGNTSAKRAPRK